jgi:hypothetical protein
MAGPADDRLFQLALTLEAMVEDCLGDRCHHMRGVVPIRPTIPCDYVATFLADEPLTIQSQIAIDSPDDGCAVGEFYAHLVVRVQRCCVLPIPNADGGWNWTQPTQEAYEDAARALMTDVLTVWQCILCNREDTFGSCSPMLLSGARADSDTCVAFEFDVELPIDSKCCVGDCS